MFTECPNCSTVFRVYPDQLAAAGGRVRCGDCLAVFDAREYRREDLDDLPATPPPAEAEAEPPVDDAPIPQGDLFEAPAPFRQELAQALSAPPAADRKPQPPARPKAPPKRRPDPTLDLPFDHDFAAPRRGTPLLGWGAAVLLLGLLAGQYLWFNRQPLSQVPALQPAMSALCGLLPCGLESLPDPAAFELTGRAVQSHPSYEGALLVDVTFLNHSNMARPYPGLEVLFTDLEGNTVASRRFSPAEYLGNGPQQPLAAGAEAHATLELLDPGDLAAGYEFRFF
jgi:predicted Zn finger-like uncharacterized protein